jgi:branched-chain amino acid transport system permease protein
LDLLGNNASIFNFILINIALGLSIYLTLSTGLLSLANAGFMGIGAYTAAIVATRSDLPLSFAFVLALTVSALVALPLGLLVLRLRDVYLAIATLGFGQIVSIVALNGDKLLRTISGDPRLTVFNGAEGITLSYVSPTLVLGLPSTTWPLLLYVLALVILLAGLQASRVGRILASIRLDEAAAATLGVHLLRSKLLAFTLGAAIAAGAGVLSTPIVRVIDPRSYVFTRAVDILAYAVLGGMTTWAGPLVGATLLTAIPEALRFLREHREIVNGLIIMLAIIFLPRGLVDPRLWATLPSRRRTGTEYDRLPSEAVGAPGAEMSVPGSQSPPEAEPRRTTPHPHRVPFSEPRNAAHRAAQQPDHPPTNAVTFPSSAPLLQVQQVSRAFGGLAALDQVSFQVRERTICGLIGPNGAGKTTLINIISGLTPASSGQVLLDGSPIDRLPPHIVTARGVARTFQNIRLFGELTVLENVLVAHELRQPGNLISAVLRLPQAGREERAAREATAHLLARLGLDHLSAVPAAALSYGDQRRLEIARALATRPRLLLLDEPAAGMNENESQRLADFLLELRASGLTLLVIEHHMDLIMRLCDQVVVLNFGRKIAEGTPDAIRADPAVVDAYLGQEVE